MTRDQIKARLLGMLTAGPMTTKDAHVKLMELGAARTTMRRSIDDLMMEGHMAFDKEGHHYVLSNGTAKVMKKEAEREKAPESTTSENPLDCGRVHPQPLCLCKACRTAKPPSKRTKKAPEHKPEEPPPSQQGGGNAAEESPPTPSKRKRTKKPDKDEQTEAPEGDNETNVGDKEGDDVIVKKKTKGGGKTSQRMKKAAGKKERTSKPGCLGSFRGAIASMKRSIEREALIDQMVKQHGPKAKWATLNYIALAKKGKLKDCPKLHEEDGTLSK